MLIGNEEQTGELCNYMYALFMLFTKWCCSATTDRFQSLRHENLVQGTSMIYVKHVYIINIKCILSAQELVTYIK